jgi:hypothetical protein
MLQDFFSALSGLFFVRSLHPSIAWPQLIFVPLHKFNLEHGIILSDTKNHEELTEKIKKID